MCSASFRDHRAILTALEAHDSRGARAEMRRHLERVDRQFTRGWELLVHDANERLRYYRKLAVAPNS